MILATFISLYAPCAFYLSVAFYNSVPSLTLLTVLECFFLFDIVLKARTLFHNEEGDRVTKTRLLA